MGVDADVVWRARCPVSFALATDAEIRRIGNPAPRVCNIGCGTSPRMRSVNVDVVCLPTVDAVADLERGLPFAAESFDVVLCEDVLEHVDASRGLAEIHRVLRPNGSVVVSTTHFTSRNLWTDPTHRRGFAWRTFEFYVRDDRSRYSSRNYYFPFAFGSIGLVHIDFNKAKRYAWNRFVEWAVNSSDAARDFWEETGLSRMFPARNLVVVLRKE